MNFDRLVLPDVEFDAEAAVLGGRADFVVAAGDRLNCGNFGVFGTDPQDPGTLTIAPAGDGQPAGIFEVDSCHIGDGRRVINEGTTQLLGWLTIAATAQSPQFDNRGAMDFQHGAVSGEVVNEAGAVITSTEVGGQGGFISGRFENHGEVHVLSGTLNLGNSAASLAHDDGNYLAEPGTGLGLAGQRVVDSEVQASQASVALSGGAAVFAGPFAADSVSTFGGSADFDNPATTMNELTMPTGLVTTVNFNLPAISLTHLVLGIADTLGGSAQVTITPGGLVEWNGGTLTGNPSGSERLVVSGASGGAPAARVLLAGGSLDGGAVLENAGLVEWLGGHVFLAGTGTTIANAGEFRADAGGDISGQATTAFHNLAGGHLLMALPGSTVGATLPFSNDGWVDVQAGTLIFGARTNGSSTGSFTAAAGATMRFDGGAQTLGAGASVAGPGTIEVSAGSLTGAAGSSIDVAGTFRVSGGTVETSGSYDAAATEVSGGALNLDSAPLRREWDARRKA